MRAPANPLSRATRLFRTTLCAAALLLCLGIFLPQEAAAQTWRAIGPPGGDVLSLGEDLQHPDQLYLGTTDGHIFGSNDAGEHWTLLGRAGARTDSVVTAILVDPRNSTRLYASEWTQEPAAGGGVFASDDGGHNWHASGLAGQAVRALAESASDPDRLVAGTLEGVFASADGGHNWQRISPESNLEIHNVDSVAIDPRHPEVVYAGTFHLPWKSSDGGRSWTSIHAGMIDDSDVMSILVDRENSEQVYASSCSGIYRSEDGAADWQKIQGIPYSARRTQAIVQDALRAQTIYAGTTEGLWKSSDGGAGWKQMTPADWVVNAVALPAGHPGRVVLGTEELGVMVSDDGGANFHAANGGFDHRAITTVAFDTQRAGRILAVLAHAREPIVVTDDGGQTWMPLGPGLTMRGLKRIYASPDGWWAALQGGGLMRYDSKRGSWVRAAGPGANLPATVPGGGPAPEAAKGASGARAARPRALAGPAVSSAATRGKAADLVVNDMAFSAQRWFAATERGLFFSEDRGGRWQRLALAAVQDLPISAVRVSRDGQSVWTVSLRGMIFSGDGGKAWVWRDLPLNSGGALSLELAPSPKEPSEPDGQTLVATAHNGLFISRNAGASWAAAGDGLPQVAVEDLAVVDGVLVVSVRTGGLYYSIDRGQSWARLGGTLGDGFFSAVAGQGAGAVMLAASASDGLYEISFTPFASASGIESEP